MQGPIVLASLLLVLLAVSPSALANHCPQFMKQIDAMLAEGPALPPAVLEQVTLLRAEGETEHNAGNHDASMATLMKAIRLINQNRGPASR